MERRGRGGGSVGGRKNIRGWKKKQANRKGRETNVKAVVHEIKRYPQNTPACDALWLAPLDVSLSLFLFVCREGSCETA